MAKGSQLGEFEMYVLAAVQRIEGEAYGIAIADEIGRRTGRITSLGSVYATVDRLADKGYLTYYTGDAQPVQGGRARKCARLTPAGRRAFATAVRDLDRMLEGLPVRTAAAPRR